MELLGEASVLVAQDKALDEIVGVFDEPAERDIAMAAIRHLAVQPIADRRGRAARHRRQAVGPPTTEPRQHATSLMVQPARVAKLVRADFVGTVRELDLDEKRFMLLLWVDDFEPIDDAP